MSIAYLVCTTFILGIEVQAKGQNSLMNKHLTVAAEHWSPFFTIEGDTDNQTYGGALWDLLKLIKVARNVTFSIVRPPKEEWGVCHDKNNCTGMIGMVNRKEVDFALGINKCK